MRTTRSRRWSRPRPIGWISSSTPDGRVNLAPYSFFNAIADTPPMVMYASNGRKTGLDEGKDTVANIRATGEFVVNIVSLALRDAMNASSGHTPPGEDEFDARRADAGAVRVVGAAAGGRGAGGAGMPGLADDRAARRGQ